MGADYLNPLGQWQAGKVDDDGKVFTASTSAVVGQAAHDAAITGNPVRTGGRAITANYTAVASGDSADDICTLVGAKIFRPNAIPEMDWSIVDSISNSSTAVQIKAALASNRHYITGLNIAHPTLGAACDLRIQDTPVASTTATIATNTLVMAATYGWKVGDLVYVVSSTVTGLTAGNFYYILTVSGASLTFSTTRGGSVSVISGTSVLATLAHIIFRTQLETTAMPLNQLTFPTPLQCGTGLAVEIQTPTNQTGLISFGVNGYTAP